MGDWLVLCANRHRHANSAPGDQRTKYPRPPVLVLTKKVEFCSSRCYQVMKVRAKSWGARSKIPVAHNCDDRQAKRLPEPYLYHLEWGCETQLPHWNSWKPSCSMLLAQKGLTPNGRVHCLNSIGHQSRRGPTSCLAAKYDWGTSTPTAPTTRPMESTI